MHVLPAPEVQRSAFLSAYLGRVKRKFSLGAAAAVVFAFGFVSMPVLAGTNDGNSVTASKAKQTKVRVMDNFFDARSVTVVPDAKVMFVWKGTNRHNVRFTKVPKGASRKGSKTKREGRWSRKFVKAGVYRYVCTLFSGMRGTVTVKPPEANPSAGGRR
jgi:plastocyanin